MKKRSIAARLGVAAFALTLVTTSLSSGTLAKYTSTFKANGQLDVAQWHVGADINYGEGAGTTVAMVESGELSMLDLANTGAAKNGTVRAGKVAPGMKGNFTINLKNAITQTGKDYKTDVAVDYAVYILPVGNAILPENFTMKKNGEANGISFADYAAEVENGSADPLGVKITDGSIAIDATAPSVQIDWEWPYETKDGANSPAAGDTQDTTDANAVAKAQFTIQVVFTQQNPSPDGGVTG